MVRVVAVGAVFAVFAVCCCAPVLALAGANPLATPGAPPPSNKKYENLFKKIKEPEQNCDPQNSEKLVDTDCKPPEPALLPKDGLTDDILEKYRLKK